jgi:hypothetical protein
MKLKTRYNGNPSWLCRFQNMDINNKARIHWACRRGMRELDISIMPFEHEYDSLSDDDKRCLCVFCRAMIRIYLTG